VCVVRRTPSHCSTTQHDMLPQHLVWKYELNCKYCNINLARNKAPWWWSDKIETCRNVLKCFVWNYLCIRWLINWSDTTKMHGATIRFTGSKICMENPYSFLSTQTGCGSHVTACPVGRRLYPSRDMKLNTLIYLVSNTRMHVTLNPLIYTASCCGTELSTE